MCGYSRNIYLFHKSIMQTLKKECEENNLKGWVGVGDWSL